MRRSWLPIVVAMMLTATSTPVAAKESARALLRRGNALFTEGEYHKARELFERAYRLNKGPTFLRSLAHCLVKVRWHADALQFFRDYLRMYPKQKDRVEITKLVRILEAIVTTKLTVRSRPMGAEIYIDSEAASSVGRTPKVMTIEPGEHLVILKREGYPTVIRKVLIKVAQEHSIRVALDGGPDKLPRPPKSTALLSIRTRPEGVAVNLDGKPLGKTPLVSFTIPSGKHSLGLAHPGRRSWETAIELERDDHVKARVSLGRSSWPFWLMVSGAGTAAVVGTITGVSAVERQQSINAMLVEEFTRYDHPTGRMAVGACNGSEPTFPVQYDPSTGEEVGDICNSKLQHTTTAMLITAGVLAAGALVYYLLTMRHEARVKRIRAR